MLHHICLLFPCISVDDDSWNPWGEDFEREGWHRPHALPIELPFNPQEPEEDEPGDEIDDLNVRDGDHVVEIWGKAAIGNVFFADYKIEK